MQLRALTEVKQREIRSIAFEAAEHALSTLSEIDPKFFPDGHTPEPIIIKKPDLLNNFQM